MTEYRMIVVINDREYASDWSEMTPEQANEMEESAVDLLDSSGVIKMGHNQALLLIPSGGIDLIRIEHRED